MGVIGLWSILDAGARPVRLEALAKKRLAVDASIWIYQFLKAVRDKEGNVLKNAHVVGFFRRICKLLFHGIRPVFVFDGKAPLLKKQTLRNRKVLREGGRIDVAKTAGKILAVQMRKRAIEEAERQKQAQDIAQREEEAVPENPVYFDELELQPAQVQRARFKKTDQYHLPELDVDLDRAGSLNDPRIMTHEELQNYAKDYEGGEDMSLYDFSKIDYDSDMFKSLPAADQYSILNAARLRSRLRMGLSTEQLTDLFPDRMAFSRFQIERVKERSDLTNRLMNMNGMNDIGVQRIASERGREYILVKNDSVDGGWSLGVVNSAEKPIIIDKELQETHDSEEDNDMDFEDVSLEPEKTVDEIQSTVGMTEDEMIKFAIEESRRAQLSATRPEAGFRPSSRRKDIRSSNARREETTGFAGKPLFLRDESMQQHMDEDYLEDVVRQSPSPSHVEARDDYAQTLEEEEAAELREALEMSMEDPGGATDIGGGGFILDEDDIEIPTVSAPEGKANDSSIPTHERFELPFQKLDFSTSLFARAKTDKDSKTNVTSGKAPESKRIDRPLDKLNRAIQSNFELDRVDLDPASKTDMQPEQNSSNIVMEATDEPATKKPLAAPSWFEEEIRRPEPRATSASPTPVEPLQEQHLTTAPKVFDLTKDDSDDDDKKSVISVATSTSVPAHGLDSLREERQGPGYAQQAGLESNSTDPASQPGIVQTSSQANVSTHVSKTDEPGSPDWGNEHEDIQIESPAQHEVYGSDGRQPAALEIELERQAEVVPILAAEESFLDEADQTRLMEEEDLISRMAAEEDEYARFSAELGHKRADNYTHTEYEQDLRALKNQQKRNLRDADEVTQIMVQECQELLAQFGIPYITAASEAESQCAHLVQLNLVDGIVTDDSDVFLFGGTRVYRNMFNAAKTVECYVLSDLEREFELDREKLIKLAHLLGSDYTEGIKKIGPVLALELVGEFGGPTGLEDFRDYVDRVQSNTETEDDKTTPFRKKFRKTAEKLVLPENFPNPLVKQAYVNPEVDEDASNFEWGQPDVDALRSFLMRSCGWHQEYTDSQLLPVIKDMNLKLREGTQRNLTDFFTGSVGAGAGGARKAVKSARMHNALSSLRKSGGPERTGNSVAPSSPSGASVIGASTATTKQKTAKKRSKAE
ncbi:protein of unknown function, partial [Taphrina deformans PYCC 5710]